MSASRSWYPTRKDRPCFGCGKTDGHCTVAADGTRSWCRKGVESPEPHKERDGSIAYLHYAGGQPHKPEAGKPPPPKISAGEWKIIAERHRTALSPSRLAKASKSLGLSERSLTRLSIGWDDDRGAYSFPMRNGAQQIIGMRLRFDNGDKSCVKGSNNGLFIPTDYDHFSAPIPEGVCNDERPLLLLLPEGPTSCAAALDIGFLAVGRPSCTGGADLLKDLLKQQPQQDVVIVGDFEGVKYRPKTGEAWWPGPEGALHLAAELMAICSKLRLIVPQDADGKPVKDIRKFIQDGGSPTIIYDIIAAAEPVTTAWLKARYQRLEKNRKAMKRPPELAQNSNGAGA